MFRLNRAWRKMAVMLVAAGIMAAPALAVRPVNDHDQECPPCNPDQLLQRLEPVKIDAIIVVNNAALQRQSSGGHALAMMLQETNYLPETRAAWRELARALDWSDEKAFDELLGQRVALVMRGLDDPQAPQWAVLSQVSGATERRLRERLRPALRGRVSGFPSFSVEDGRYELVVGPAGVAGNGRQQNDGAMILLAPGGDNRLITQLAPMLLRPIAPLRDAAGRDCDVVLLLRQAGAPDGTGAGNVLLTGTLEEGGWGFRLMASPGMVWGRPAAMERIIPWTDAAFKSLERDALVAMMGVIGSTTLQGISSVHALAGVVPVIPLSLDGEAFGQRAAFYIREEPMRPAAVVPAARAPAHATGGRPSSSAVRPQSLDSAVPDRFTHAVAEAPRGVRLEPGRLSIGMAIEARDAQQMLFEGDHLIARLVGGLESGRFEQRQLQRVQFVVAVPEQQVRAFPLRGKPIHYLWARGMEAAFGEDPIVSWGVRTARGALQAEKGPIPGWWAASLSPADLSTVERDAAALAAGGPGVALPRLSIGMVRPAALKRAVARLDPHFLAPMRAMKWIDSIRWDAWQREDGAVEATIRIRMHPGAQ